MFKAIAIGFALIALNSCASLQPVLTQAQISDVDLKDKKLKEAESCGGYILGLIGPIGGLPSYSEVINQAGISKVIALEHRYKYYVLYSEICIAITGY